MNPPHDLAYHAEGDLKGRGRFVLVPRPDGTGTDVTFYWDVNFPAWSLRPRITRQSIETRTIRDPGPLRPRPRSLHWPATPAKRTTDNGQRTKDNGDPTDTQAIERGIRAIPPTRQPGITYNTTMTTYQVVLDTNVVVSALRSRLGASHKLLSLVGTFDRFHRGDTFP